MRTNYTTKQFAEYLRKLCASRDEEEWVVTPIKPVEDKYLVAEFNELHGKGDYFYFSVRQRYTHQGDCGVYVGPKRFIEMIMNPYNVDPLFEKRLADCLAGK
jgi:hypothetical protein